MPRGSPFVIGSVVVGNVQYPEEVSTAVSRKLAATQELQRKDTEIEIERKERTKREVQAQGIANAMADHPRAAEPDVHPARSNRSAEADGGIAEPYRRLHPRRSDGRAGDGDVRGHVAARQVGPRITQMTRIGTVSDDTDLPLCDRLLGQN